MTEKLEHEKQQKEELRVLFANLENALKGELSSSEFQEYVRLENEVAATYCDVDEDVLLNLRMTMRSGALLLKHVLEDKDIDHEN